MIPIPLTSTDKPSLWERLHHNEQNPRHDSGGSPFSFWPSHLPGIVSNAENANALLHLLRIQSPSYQGSQGMYILSIAVIT